MLPQLSLSEVRILGCLVEKELATPEYYPLTLNSLLAAANQKSNRDPVVEFDDKTVARALESLRFNSLVRQSAEGVRAARYCHSLAEKYMLEPLELAVIAELMLRGPQTAGELRTRCARMAQVPEIDGMLNLLESLESRDPCFIVRLPRQPGRKEIRFAHLFSPVEDVEPAGHPVDAVVREVYDDNLRISKLETEVNQLKELLSALQNDFDNFRKSFE